MDNANNSWFNSAPGIGVAKANEIAMRRSEMIGRAATMRRGSSLKRGEELIKKHSSDEKKLESASKPGSVVDNHSSRTTVARSLKQPTRIRSGPPHGSLFGLAPSGVYRAMNCCQPRGALLPHPFTLTCADPKTSHRRFALCCTSRRLTPPRRYLALCPMEPGLSSPCLRKQRLPRLTPAAIVRAYPSESMQS